MTAERETIGPVTFMVTGELDPGRLDDVLRYLGGQGLTATLLPDAGPSQPEELPYHLDGIDDPAKYLVQEHLYEYRDAHVPDVTRNRFDRVFGFLSGSSQASHRTHPLPSPASHGLVVAGREEAGFPRSLHTRRDAAVLVGPLLDFSQRAIDENLSYPFFGPPLFDLLAQVCGLLRGQIEQSAKTF
jgi:hypothetical protein